MSFVASYGDVPGLAEIDGLVAGGRYAEAAETAARAFAAAEPSTRLPLLHAWEEIAYALRPVGTAALHPWAAEVVPALVATLAGDELPDVERGLLDARRVRMICWSEMKYRPEAEAAVEFARAAGDAEAVVYALFALHTTLGAPDTAEEALGVSREMLRAGAAHPSAVVRSMVHWRSFIDCQLVGDAPGRDTHLRSLLMACEEAGTPYWRAIALMSRAGDELLQGNYDEAAAAFPALVASARTFPGLLLAAISTMGVIREGQTGQLRDAQISREITGLRSLHPSFRIGVAYYLALLGRTTEARVELQAVDYEGMTRDVSFMPSAAMALEAAANHLRDRELTERTYKALLPYERLVVVSGPAQGTWGPASLYLGFGAEFLELPEARAHFERARDMSAAMRARPFLAQALARLGRMDATIGDPGGQRQLEEALAIARRIGLAGVEREASAALRPAPQKRKALLRTELSERERQVLALTATGLTAAEVAEKLVLSRRTVEKHLEHAYGKIGARNRGEGVAWAIVNGLTQDT